jgi:hypothetical protein
MSITFISFIQALAKALSGRRRWLQAKHKYGIEKNGVYLVVMPDADQEFNEHALRHLDDFLDYRKGSAAVILTTDEWVADSAHTFSRRISAIERITEREQYHLSQYYYYSHFSEHFVMMSLQGVYGKRLALACGVNGITKEDMACLGLYVIRNYPQSTVPRVLSEVSNG